MLNFYDFEVFEKDWMVVIINPVENIDVTIVNDRQELTDYYEAHKDEIFIGYNSRQYDQYIFKSILLGLDPKKVNDHIIVDGQGGWNFSSAFRQININNYDVMTSFHGLKQLEGFMGNDIRETTVPFDIKRKLTEKELSEVAKYCHHDVEQTIEVFLQRKSDFEAHVGLIKMFDLPLARINKTKVQLSAMILEARKPARPRDDEFDISIPDTLDVHKYRDIVRWYENPINRDYEKKLVTDVAGVEHIFAWGGLHGAIPKYYGEGVFIMADVASLYPSLMIEYDYQSRNIADPKKYVDIYHTRLKYKAEKNPLQAPLKIVLNGTYGAMKDQHNNLYDPRQANNVCVAGQLLLLDLIEHLESHCQLIQSNTDGILIKLKSIDDYDLIDDLAWEWEKRTRLKLEFDLYKKVIQKDVNNYVLVDFDGKTKTKGAYVKKLNGLDYDLPIVNNALVKYLIDGTSIESTINNCHDLKEFQKIVKVSSKYFCGWHNGQYLTDKTFRVFASINSNDTYIGKMKTAGATIEKFANTPEHCFIQNDDVNGCPVPEKLDREWYVKMTKERLKQFKE